MELYSELQKIEGLNHNTDLRVICSDGIVIEGKYRGYIQSLDNEPEIPQLDILSSDGKMYGLLESEIISIKGLAR